MDIGAYLTGPAGRTQELRNAFNEKRRRDGDPVLFSRQLRKDTENFIKKQEDAGFDFVVDPSYHNYFLFQSLTERVPGIEKGPQEPWFHRNVFYWRPQIESSLNLALNHHTKSFTSFSDKHLLVKTGKGMAILPSPYTLLELSDIDKKDYPSKNHAITDLALLLRNEATLLVEDGFKRIQYDEPSIVKRQSNGSLEEEHLDLLSTAMTICGNIPGATTSLHTYFGNAGENKGVGKDSLIPYLFGLPVDCVGIDVTWTPPSEIAKHGAKGKELALGFFDGDTTYEEDPQWIAEQTRMIMDKSKPSKVYLTPNTGMDYIGSTKGEEKIDLLAKTRKWATNYSPRTK